MSFCRKETDNVSLMDERKRQFFQSMFLECVCDAERKSFLENGIQMGLTEFRTKIAERPYDELLDFFAKMMGAKTAVLFQTRKCKTLPEGFDSRSITILSRSSESASHRIGILRSELLNFYNGACPRKGPGPASSLLMEIKDTVRVVAVAETQHDPMVVE